MARWRRSAPQGPWIAVIGGMDPTGGAGVWRDVWTLRAVAPSLEVRVVVTALTRQGHGRPATAHPVAPERFAEQLRARAVGGPPVAIKVGLVPEGLAQPLADWLEGQTGRVVLDPVLVASDGGALGSSALGVVTLARGGAVDLLTPNGDEAGALLDAMGVEPDEDPVTAALRLADALGTAVLLKGGHRLVGRAASQTGQQGSSGVLDVLVADGRVQRYPRPRVPGPEVRGTGCALASAIAGALARGDALAPAVTQAVAWLDATRARARAVGFRGRTTGPLHLP